MTINYFLTVGFDGSDAIGVQGLITERDDGTTHYRSYTQNGTSRKPKASVAAAIPRTFAGYIVNADSVDQAIRSTKAFRDGAHWAAHANRTGDIRIVRRGRIEG
jgi:hypothetical protein|tara:strand:+ start:972 stop:1283 length:312 start_codon:yes stop_codon:yes gene_type:complete